jgi:hypothetical protein
MATIRNRGPYQCQAIVRKRGCPEQRRTFETEREANDWAAGLEVDMTRSAFVDRSLLERTTFGDLLARYLLEVAPKKRGLRQRLPVFVNCKSNDGLPIGRRAVSIRLRHVPLAPEMRPIPAPVLRIEADLRVVISTGLKGITKCAASVNLTHTIGR